MALLDAELARIRHELKYNLISIGALPYIDYTSWFERIVQPYLGAGATTTSVTAVTAASTPTPVTLALASGTGFATFARVVVDVDDRQEIATAQNVSGNNVTLLLVKAHTGTYPVTVEGGETIVREILQRIAEVKAKLATTFGYGALKRVDEVEFYDSGSETQFGMLGGQLKFWRCELASALGLDETVGCGGGGAMAVY